MNKTEGKKTTIRRYLMSSITFFCCIECHYAKCRYTECHYAEYYYAKCHYTECH
jgi:hypothetical protein